MTDPTFAPGARVRVAKLPKTGYKRRPDYVTGATGIVERVHGAYVPPGHDGREVLYSVRFEPSELWDDPDENGAVYLDLWEGALTWSRDRARPEANP